MLSFYGSLGSELWCPLRFLHKIMFVSSLPPLVCVSYLRSFRLYLHLFVGGRVSYLRSFRLYLHLFVGGRVSYLRSFRLYLHLFACLIYVFCVCLHIVVSNTFCVVFLLCFSSSCCCQFPLIVICWLPLRYSLTFIWPSSYPVIISYYYSWTSNVAIFSGMRHQQCHNHH